MSLFKKDSMARRAPSEVLGLDLGTTATKVVRLRNGHEGMALVAADILPAVNLKSDAPPTLVLPPRLVTNYAAVARSTNQQTVRIITVPNTTGENDPAFGTKLQDVVKAENDQRLAYTVLRVVPAKREAQTLVASAPEAEVASVLAMLASGPPAAITLEHAGLAALTAFNFGPGREVAEDAVCLIDAGAQSTFITFVNKGVPVLIRTLDLGGEHLLERLQTQWGLDRETAMGALGQSATIDVSQPIHDLVTPFLRQLSISRDFVERQESCRVSRAYVSGGMSLIRHWVQEIHDATGLEIHTWDPLQKLMMAPNALPANLEGQNTRLAAAIGAALSVIEET